ncbi:MAG: hypothetical protein AAGD38_22120, partial [Acidobacteriota bacterium]
AAALPASYADAGPHQNPIAEQDNWVYARVKNLGTDASLDYYVRISITHWPGLEFTYPESFVPTNRPGDPVPSPMTPGTYLIGEIAATELAPDGDTIVSVKWPAALVPPETVMVGLNPVTWHPCLLVEVSPHDGPTATGNHVWDDNNLAQKNLSITYPDNGDDFAFGVIVGNLVNPAPYAVVDIDRSRLPRDIRLWVDLVDPTLKDHLRDVVNGGELPTGCHITFLEDTRLRIDCHDKQTELTVAADTPLTHVIGNGGNPNQSVTGFTLGHHQGREVAFLDPRGPIRIPVIGGAGTLHPIVIGGVVGENSAPGRYNIHVTQRQPDGTTTGAVELEVNVGGNR